MSTKFVRFHILHLTSKETRLGLKQSPLGRFYWMRGSVPKVATIPRTGSYRGRSEGSLGHRLLNFGSGISHILLVVKQ